MRFHLFKALPFALAASFVQAQTLPEAMQKALDVHPEIQAGVNSRLAADYQLKAAKGGTCPVSTCSPAMAVKAQITPLLARVVAAITGKA